MSGKKIGRPVKWTDERIEEEAKFLEKWADDESSIVLGRCYAARGYSYHDANEWPEKNESYKEARRVAMTKVGARREEKALLGKIDCGIVRYTMAMYDPCLKAYIKELKRSELEKDVIEEQTKKMILESIAKDSIVSNKCG